MRRRPGRTPDQPGGWPPADLVESIRGELGGASTDLGVVLGSGLGGLADRLDPVWQRDAVAIPGYPHSTVAGHRGRLLLGRLGDRLTWVVQGRVHLYEGHAVETATRYVRLLHALGVRRLILTNASGSVDARAAGPGDGVLCRDAIGLYFRPLAAPAWNGPWRVRGPLTDPELARKAEETAREESIPLRSGILVASLGPTYETAAEVRAWRAIGGTVASMSTVPEAMVARELQMRCLIFSLVTNLGTGLSPHPLSHEEVVEVADRAGRTLERLLVTLVARL